MLRQSRFWPRKRRIAALAMLGLLALTARAGAAEPISSAALRFASATGPEVPDLQRHVVPLFGRLGCNGRACHGSFQGQGGFRLSLFGYDFATDHDALLKADSGRVDVEAPEVSKILQKPTLAIPHKGGKRMEPDGWEYQLLLRWIKA